MRIREGAPAPPPRARPLERDGDADDYVRQPVLGFG